MTLAHPRNGKAVVRLPPLVSSVDRFTGAAVGTQSVLVLADFAVLGAARVPIGLAESVLMVTAGFVVPVVGVAGHLRHASRLGVWFVTASLACSFVLGVLFHFVLDTGTTLRRIRVDGFGSLARVYETTATLQVLTALVGVIIAAVAWRRRAKLLTLFPRRTRTAVL